MYNSSRELVETLRASIDTLTTLLDNVTQEQALAARGGDENWSILEVVCHLRDAEEHALGRMQTIRDAVNPRIAGFDQEAWARERDYLAADLQNAFAAFVYLRTQHVEELASLTADQWARSGLHQEHGPVTIGNHTLHMVWHDAVHMAQVARQLASHKGAKTEPVSRP